MRVSGSRRINLGVVPLEIREWNPLTAPQAMVINAKGKIVPANTGPLPSAKRVRGGIFRDGGGARLPTANGEIVPRFPKVLKKPRAASGSHTGNEDAANP